MASRWLPKPGDALAKAISLFGVMLGHDNAACGACVSRQVKMNAWGWRRSWIQRRLIAAWLKDGFGKRLGR